MAAINIAYDRETFTMHLWDDKKGYTSFPYRRYAYKKHPNGKYRSLYGDKCERVNRFSKEEAEEGLLFESDVDASIRTLVDMYIENDDVSTGHRLCIFDIETSVANGFPDKSNPINEITAIALYDQVTDHYHVCVLDPQGQIESSETDTRTLYSLKDEISLLQTFLVIYNEINPTILSGWNIEFFDIPYLYARIKAVLGNQFANMLSPIGKIQWDDFANRYRIFGVSTLDYLSLYKKYAYQEQASYQLDAISNKELGKGKITYEGTLDDLYQSDINKYIEYNINDVVLVKEIDDKLQYIELVKTICHTCHVPYEDIFLTSKCLEGALLTYMKRNGIVAPNKKFRTPESDEKKISGAYVQDPKATKMMGRHEWIFDCDATSLYPSVIMTLNISPETKIGKVQQWKNLEELMTKPPKIVDVLLRSGKTKSFSFDEFNQWVIENNYAVSANGVLYNQTDVGLIPSILSTWFDQRVQYRKLAKQASDQKDLAKFHYYDKRQLVQKILLNSMYGVLGNAGFRFYDTDNAEAVTTSGVQLIKFSAATGNKLYNNILNPYSVKYTVKSGTFTIDSTAKLDIEITEHRTTKKKAIYGFELKEGDVLYPGAEVLDVKHQTVPNKNFCVYIDTDSLFFSAKPILIDRYPSIDLTSYDDVVPKLQIFVDEFQTFVNEELSQYAKVFHNVHQHRFSFKQEMIARSGFWVAKKRYALWIINENGRQVDEMLVKGIDVVRSNFAAVFRSFMKTVLKMILDNASKPQLDKFVEEFRNSLATIDLSQIAKPTSVKNIDKWNTSSLSQFKLRTPAHVKAAISYNNLLKHLECSSEYSPIFDRGKIKWVYLKNNPLGLKTVAFKGYDDPDEIISFIREYICYDKIFEANITKKLEKFYGALGWTIKPVNQLSDKFFTFYD